MSRYTRTTNPHDLFEDNVHEANGLRDKKAIERQQRLSEERASIDALNREIAEEERIRNAKKAALRNEQEEITAQMRQLSVQDDARSEYLANKKKNNSSFNAILNQDSQSQQNFPQNQNFDNDTKSYYSKLEQQKQYRDYLDSQVTAKHQVDQMTKNALSSGPNPYKALREKNSKFTISTTQDMIPT